MAVVDGSRCGLLLVSLAALACGPSVIVATDTEAAAQPVDSSTGGAPTTPPMDGNPVPPDPSTTSSPSTSTTTPGGLDDATFGPDEGPDEGHTFILRQDFACSSLPPGYAGHCSECSVWEQDCPRGEKCVAWANDGGGAWNATRCSPVDATPAAVGEACMVEGSGASGIDDCDFGSMCWFVDAATSVGICTALCTGDERNPICEDSTCSISNGGVLNVCVPTCDPVGEACLGASKCSPSPEGFWCLPVTGEIGYGEACGFGGCGDGLLCLDGPASGCEITDSCCTAYCDLDAGDPNPSCPDAAIGQLCAPYPGPPLPEELQHVGVCALPV